MIISLWVGRLTWSLVWFALRTLLLTFSKGCGEEYFQQFALIVGLPITSYIIVSRSLWSQYQESGNYINYSPSQINFFFCYSDLVCKKFDLGGW